MHHRRPYHSPRGRDHDCDRDDDCDRDRDIDFVFLTGFPFSPWWGYPYYPFQPSYWDTWDDSDSQPYANYAPAEPYQESGPGPYAEPGPEEYQPESQPYQPWPYSKPAPSTGQLPSSYTQASSAAESAVTVVFKDGRPPVQIRNYLLTPTTLSVLDQRRRDIPVDQIDLAATARVNRDAGVDFALPGGTR